MSKRTLYFWLIFVASLVISSVIISVFVKALKLILLVILVLAITPIVFFTLKKLLLPDKKNGSDKLKTRH